jgi:hypothetical protein
MSGIFVSRQQAAENSLAMAVQWNNARAGLAVQSPCPEILAMIGLSPQHVLTSLILPRDLGVSIHYKEFQRLHQLRVVVNRPVSDRRRKVSITKMEMDDFPIIIRRTVHMAHRKCLKEARP